ncbi:MAG: sulfide-dependent adenosine diphosphate thiazole synthase [Candidatus Omnitrophica bacterium]|nr:sulfide-dependent adenosine diphosphate thiazole synthase [Candidatus Omnitrophota bacterium]
MICEADITRAIIKTATEELLNNIEVDVIIAGGGPTGLTCARYLAQAGKRVVLFERKLSYGGGMPGGGMLFPRIVIQKEAAGILEEIKVRLVPYDKKYYTADSVEAISKMAVAAIDAGLRIYPAVSVEDVVIREDDRVSGAVINWSSVLMAGLHVDPLAIMSKFVVDATGHEAFVTRVFVQKNPDVRLKTKTGKVIGEKSMWAQKGEADFVRLTKEIFPGLVLSGMAVNAVLGMPRMGAIFGGMLFSGKRAAEIILKKLNKKSLK